MALTTVKINKAKAQDKPYKLHDERKLYLLVSTKGTKTWKFDYRIDSKQNTLGIGRYPTVSLKDAREQAEDARRLINKGIDPCHKKKADKRTSAAISANTFGALANDWFETWKVEKSDSTVKNCRRVLDSDLLPTLKQIPITEIKPQDILVLAKAMEKQGKIPSANNIITKAGQVFDHAIIQGKLINNPANKLKTGIKAHKTSHNAAIVDPLEYAKYLNAVDQPSKRTPNTTALMQLTPYFFCRPKTLRALPWSAIDWENKTALIKEDKMGTELTSPLSRQAMTLLTEQYKLTGNKTFVFHSKTKTGYIGDNTHSKAIKALGYDKKQTAHGHRATAKTILTEVLEYQFNTIEAQLSHRVTDANGRAYNRTTYLKERTKMMQSWADYLDNVKAEVLSNGKVIAGNFKQA